MFVDVVKYRVVKMQVRCLPGAASELGSPSDPLLGSVVSVGAVSIPVASGSALSWVQSWVTSVDSVSAPRVGSGITSEPRR